MARVVSSFVSSAPSIPTITSCKALVTFSASFGAPPAHGPHVVIHNMCSVTLFRATSTSPPSKNAFMNDCRANSMSLARRAPPLVSQLFSYTGLKSSARIMTTFKPGSCRQPSVTSAVFQSPAFTSSSIASSFIPISATSLSSSPSSCLPSSTFTGTYRA